MAPDAITPTLNAEIAETAIHEGVDGMVFCSL